MTSAKRKKSGDVVRASVSFKRPDYKELEEIAKEKKVSVAWVVRDAVGSYLSARTPLFRSGGDVERIS